MRSAPRDIEAALDVLGIDYVVHGDEATARCPNPQHNDHSPSWSCNLSTGMHNCFACGFGGSFAKLVMALRLVDRKSAEDWCATFLKSAEDIAARLKGTDRRTWDPAPVREPDLALFTAPPGSELARRGLTAEAAAAYGVLWDLSEGGWILPVRDPFSGRLRGWQRKGKDSVKNHPYGLDKADTLFGYHLLREDEPVILVESPLDAVRMLSAGIRGAVATYGANFSERQILLITGVTERVVDAFDDDDAGHKASGRLLLEWKYLLRLTEFDYGDTGAKDPGEMTDEEIHRGMPRAR